MLNIQHVEKKYGGKPALKDVNLTIQRGRCYGLVGPNGAGKSTLMKIVASVIQDFQGDVQVSDSFSKKAFKTEIGYIPQEICVEPTVSATSNLLFFGKLYGLKGSKLRGRVKAVLEDVGLTERANDKVITFSGGMRRRLNIGCALMHEPELIIMDEPTVGIDPQSRAFIFGMIEEMKRSGRTIIYASHHMEEVEQICDEIAFLDHGEVIEKGEVNALLQKYAIPAVYVKGSSVSQEDFHSLGTVENKSGGFLLKTKNPLHAMEQITAIYRQKESALERLELVQPRLENVFMDLTGSALRD